MDRSSLDKAPLPNGASFGLYGPNVVDGDVISLDLGSTRRDRVRWPNPFNFEAPLNNTGQKIDGIEAYDPVTIQLPVALGSIPSINGASPIQLQWLGLDVLVNALTGTINNISSDSVTLTLLPSFQQEYNYYRGLLGTFSAGGFGHILTYTYLGNSMAQVIFDTPIPSSTTIGSTFSTSYNSTITAAANNPLVFIPRTMALLNLNGYQLYNESLNEYRTIVNYDTTASIATLSAPIPTWTNTNIYSVRQAVPFTTTITGSTTTNVMVTNASIGVGDFVKDRGTNDIRQVVMVNGTTLTFSTPVAVPWTVGGVVELLSFNRDNFAFINYSSLQREALTTQYLMRLVFLTVPLQQLKNSSSVESLPYLYVEIRDTSNPITNTFMSNNEGSKRATFKVSLKRTVNGSFLKYTGDKDVMLLKFRPSGANFRFTVMAPDGRPLELLEKDTTSPDPPNPLLQTSALVHIQRLNLA